MLFYTVYTRAMIKEQILNYLKTELTDELEKAKKAYTTTKNLVQTGDLKSDGKYDTRATEANYLADGQRQRINEIEQDLELLDTISLNLNAKQVEIGSLVEISLNDEAKKYFVTPVGGGKMVPINNEVVLIISVFSPLGDAALSLEVGEEFELELPSGTRNYKILSIE